MNEIWKDVENTSGRYQISSEGRLRTKDHDDYVLVRPYLDRNGYQCASITFDDIGKTKRMSIHRLVAIAFINNPYNLPIVHHIDENKLLIYFGVHMLKTLVFVCLPTMVLLTNIEK